MPGIHVCQECLCPNSHVLTIEHVLVHIIPEHVCVIVILFILDVRPRNTHHYITFPLRSQCLLAVQEAKEISDLGDVENTDQPKR